MAEYEGMMEEAEAIARDIRDRTTDLCIEAIESLYLNSQGLILCADTIDACANVLRSLKAGRALQAKEGKDG